MRPGNNKKLFDKSGKNWLDETSSQAANEFGTLSWYVRVEKDFYDSKAYDAGRNSFDVEAELRVTDCFKIINIAFGVHTGGLAAYDERIGKVENMIGMLTQFRDAMVEGRAAAEAYLSGPFEKKDTDKSDEPSE